MMKRRILIFTLVLLVAGTAVLGFDVLNLTPDEAYEAANKNNLQREIDELNHELKAISLENSEKTAEYTAVNTYQGKLTKYLYPFDASTNLAVSQMNLEKAEKQLMVDIHSAMVALKESREAFLDAKDSYELSLAEYKEGLSDSSIASAELLSLEYAGENNRIKMLQAEQNMNRRQKALDGMLGIEGSSVVLSTDYSSPYGLDAKEVFDSAIEEDVSIYQAKRSYESAVLKHEIAEEFFDEEDETFISTLSAMKSAELNYNRKLVGLEATVLDNIDNLKNLFDSITLGELNVRLKKEMYNASLKQYEAGILPVKSLKSSEDAYKYAKRQLDSSIHDYIIACMQFKINTGYIF